MNPDPLLGEVACHWLAPSPTAPRRVPLGLSTARNSRAGPGQARSRSKPIMPAPMTTASVSRGEAMAARRSRGRRPQPCRFLSLPARAFHAAACGPRALWPAVRGHLRVSFAFLVHEE